MPYSNYSNISNKQGVSLIFFQIFLPPFSKKSSLLVYWFLRFFNSSRLFRLYGHVQLKMARWQNYNSFLMPASSHIQSVLTGIEYWSFWCLFTSCYFDRTNSIKTNLHTCNFQINQFISYKFINQFWLNLSFSSSKSLISIQSW